MIFAGIALGAGRWDLQSIIQQSPGSITQPGQSLLGVTVSNANFNLGFGSYVQPTAAGQGVPVITASPMVRVTGPGTYYAIAYSTYLQRADNGSLIPGGNMSVQGTLNARPVME